jgi:phosphatidylserine decarboxylase
MEIRYIDRRTEQLHVEDVYGGGVLRYLYSGSFLSKIFLFLSSLPIVSYCYGLLQKWSWSARKVGPFIEKYGIDASEFEKTHFTSFNDFFIRKLKPEARPVVPDTNRLAMPADGRYFVYPHFEQFRVKGKDFSIRTFLDDEQLAERYENGSMAIARLCPIDYHRVHFPCDGVASPPRPIDGTYYSVSPIALAKRLSILAENKRVVTEIQSEQFGRVLFIEIGATCVGSIHQTFNQAEAVRKGDEKAYFDFGGSCVVLLFEEGRVSFDPDLIENTRRGLETFAHFGDSLGSSQS